MRYSGMKQVKKEEEKYDGYEKSKEGEKCIESV
jgi:hypothetical protein